MSRLIIPPLEGKYYSSTAQIVLDDGRTVDFQVTSDDDWTPSEREEFLRKHPEEISDGHYERSATFEALKLLEKAINNA